jgi:hypothetical protein
MKPAKHIFISVAVSVALVALLASPATARVVNSSSDSAAPQSNEIPAIVFKTHPVSSSPADTPLVKTVEVSDSTGSTGFDWNDALIGAGSALVFVLVIGGTMTLVRRRDAPGVQPTV